MIMNKKGNVLMMMIDVKDPYRFDLMYKLLLNHVMIKVEHQVQQL